MLLMDKTLSRPGVDMWLMGTELKPEKELDYSFFGSMNP
jgi:hypothetical protein